MLRSVDVLCFDKPQYDDQGRRNTHRKAIAYQRVLPGFWRAYLELENCRMENLVRQRHPSVFRTSDHS